jgi:hypothetical protein
MTCGCAEAKPVACSLASGDLRERRTVIRELNRRALLARSRDGLQLRLTYDAAAEEEVRDLVALERECCSFLDFRMDHRDGHVLVTITAPIGSTEAVEEIFSELAGDAPPAA